MKAQRKAESIARAEAGQAALDRGKQPTSIDANEAARYQALARGEKATRESQGFCVAKALRKAEDELAMGSVEDFIQSFDETLAMMDLGSQLEALKNGIKELAKPRASCAAPKTPLKKHGKKKRAPQLETAMHNDLDQDDNDKTSAIDVEGDFAIYEDEDDDDTSTTAHHISERTRTSPPRRRDEATFGKPESPIACDLEEQEARVQRLHDYVRLIVRHLKVTAAQYIKELGHSHRFNPMTRQYTLITHNADEDWLVHQVIDSLPISTKMVLGKEDLAIDDLLSLPCWTEDKLSQHGIYLDVVKDPTMHEPIAQLYVGSATGKAGLSHRWAGYVSSGNGKSHVTGLHDAAIFNKIANVNLRALAGFGHDPISWLALFCESVFMVFFGTVRDTGIRWNSRNPNMCCPEIYKVIEACRDGLPAPLGPGLNSTWSLAQGFRTNYDSDRARCCNDECRRRMVPKKHPDYQPNRFTSNDALHPGEEVKCINCTVYEKRHQGATRPRHIEERRAFRDANPRQQCMWGDCTQLLQYHHWKTPAPEGFENGTIVKDRVVTRGAYLWACSRHERLFRKLRRTNPLAQSAAQVPTSPVPHSMRSFNPYPSYGGRHPPKRPTWGGESGFRRLRKIALRQNMSTTR
jgi:hypothetical protein